MISVDPSEAMLVWTEVELVPYPIVMEVMGAPPVPGVNEAITEVDVICVSVTMLGGLVFRGIVGSANDPATVLVPPPPAADGLNRPDAATVALPSTACVTVNAPER